MCNGFLTVRLIIGIYDMGRGTISQGYYQCYNLYNVYFCSVPKNRINKTKTIKGTIQPSIYRESSFVLKMGKNITLFPICEISLP